MYPSKEKHPNVVRCRICQNRKAMEDYYKVRNLIAEIGENPTEKEQHRLDQAEKAREANKMRGRKFREKKKAAEAALTLG